MKVQFLKGHFTLLSSNRVLVHFQDLKDLVKMTRVRDHFICKFVMSLYLLHFHYKTLIPSMKWIQSRRWLPSALLFQILLRHENSEPCATQLHVQFTQVLSAFHARAMLQYFGSLIGNGVAYFLTFCLSQLVDTQWLHLGVMFVSET